MMDEFVKRFFQYAVDRYRIFLAKANGFPAPWTDDPILRSYRFCNVFREDDKVTEWLRTNVRNPLRENAVVIPAIITCRFFNRIESMELIVKNNLHTDWDVAKLQRVFKGVKPIVGAAYIIKTPNGMDKLRGLISILDEVWTRYHDGELVQAVEGIRSMEKLVSYLTAFPYFGKFTAYEMACDLQYTKFFHPTDTDIWANPGPGAQRGLQRILNGAVGGGKLYDSVMLAAMQELLRLSQNPHNWVAHWPRWDMRTVEHTLCEFDKYERARLGEGTPKQKYGGV
jgi:5-hmdU DNA kinase-like protein